MKLDTAAPVAGSCASLWACSSPRSLCRAQPAPWLWCCRTCCVKHWTAAGYVYRCSPFQSLFHPGRRSLCSRGIYILCRALTFPTEWTPPQPASPLGRLAGGGSDLSISCVSRREGGPKLEKQTSIPHLACFTRGEENGAKQRYLRIFPLFNILVEIFFLFYTICRKDR